MLLALLSDTHDNQASTRAALDLLQSYHPDAYLHAGDLVSPHMLPLFDGLPFHFVFGNNEYDLAALRSMALAHNLTCHERLADLTFDGHRIAVLHGHEHSIMNSLLRSGKYRYIIHGHTHTRRDEQMDGVRLINPGALHRSRVRSIALLDLASDHLQFLDVPTM